MTPQLIQPLIAWLPRRWSLRTVLVVPFLLQIVGAVGLVGYLSFRNGQQAVDDLVLQLCAEVNSHIEQELYRFLSAPHRLHRHLEVAIDQGYVDSQDLTELKGYFWQLLQADAGVTNVGLSTQQGATLAVSTLDGGGGVVRLAQAGPNPMLKTYAVDADGEPTALLKVKPTLSGTQHPWYKIAAEAGQPTWTNIFPSMAESTLAISAVHPIYNAAGELEAVLHSWVPLTEISRVLEHVKIGQTGQSFIVDPNGYLVATSTQELALPTTAGPNQSPDLGRIKAVDSTHPITRSASQYLAHQFGSFQTIPTVQQTRTTLANQTYFVQVQPFQDGRGLNWVVVVVVPEADFMAQIYANNRSTALLCFLTLGIATLASLIMARRLAKVIGQIADASIALAEGTTSTPIAPSPIIEMDGLATAFNDMAQQLQTSFAQLADKNDELQSVLEAFPLAVAIHNRAGDIIYLNQRARQILPQGELPIDHATLTDIHQIYQRGTKTPYPIEQLPATRSLRGEFARANDLEVWVQGQAMLLEGLGTPVFDEQGLVKYVIATFQDISDRQRAEQILADYSRALETEVNQRTLELETANAQLHREIEDRQQVELALYRSQQQLQLITDSVPAGIAYVDAERRYRFVNRIYEQRFSRPREEMVGKYVWEVIGLATYNAVKATIDAVLAGQLQQTEFGITYEDGKFAYINSILTPDIDEAGQVIGYYLVFVDLTQRRQLEESLKAANAELQRLATVDGLTQVANRRQFDTYLANEWPRLARAQAPLSLLLLDIDFFKRYNDGYGHQLGDSCLISVAQALQRTVHRPSDLVARYGGEEFAIILPNTDESGAIIVAQELRQAVQDLAIPHKNSTVSDYVTISIGIASQIPTPTSTPEALIGHADQALYQAKQAGRDRYQVALRPPELMPETSPQSSVSQ